MRIFLTLIFTLFLTACGNSVDTDTLRHDVGQRLSHALPDGTLEIVRLERRGSQADTKAPSGETRRIVYYDIDLKLTRAVDFGAWNAPGVAGLVSALGAGPRSITGIMMGGNQAGDVIRAHGTALYKQEGDTWVAVIPAGYQPPIAPQYADAARPHSTEILEAIRKIIDSTSNGTSPALDSAISEELRVAQTNIQARLTRATEGYAIAAGAEHGQYIRVARVLFNDAAARTVPLITKGGVENLLLLRSGRVSLALAQGDSALDAYEGRGAFAGMGPYHTLRAIGSLYPEPVHVLVHQDSDISTMADLKGKRIAIGLHGSASRVTALRVLQAHGMEPGDYIAHELDLGEALVALQQGQVDAVIQIIGMPADSVRAALTATPLRLLALDPTAIQALTAGRLGYFAYTIPASAYSTQGADIPTIATAALLVTNESFPDTEIATLTRLVYGPGKSGPRDLLALGSAQGVQISAATGGLGLSIPQHLAAAKVLQELTAPDADDGHEKGTSNDAEKAAIQ